MFNLKSLFAFSLFVSILIHSYAAKAGEQILATISNDENKNTYMLVIDADEDGREIRKFYKDVYTNGKKITREILDYRILDQSGMVLEKRDKYVVLKLKCANFDEMRGGIITVDTLYNGASGTRKAYEVQLAQSKLGWSLINKGKPISKIHIQSNKVMMLGTVGIKNIVMK